MKVMELIALLKCDRGDSASVMRMAEENPTLGYRRIRRALKNVGHRVGRSTIARILKAKGIAPMPERPTSWRLLPIASTATIILGGVAH
jgi:helix-turn-helix protein